MKRIIRFGLLCLTSLSLTSCGSKPDNSNNGNTKTDDENVELYSAAHLEKLKNEYGELSIKREDGKNPTYTYVSEKNEYRINVEKDIKAKYVISGYTEAHITIGNGDNLTSFKGVKIKLDRACLVSKTESPSIYYSLQSKNVEVTPKNETENYIISLNGSNGIDSENNIEIGGNGTLSIYTKQTTSLGNGGHCIKSSNKVSIYDTAKLNLTSAHDGINCDDIITINEDDNTTYAGTINFNNIVSQAMEATTKKCGGSISLSGGKYIIDNAESVFKSDEEINIASGVEVIATNIKGEPIVKQSKDEVESNITIPVLNLVVNGTFTSNGNSITSGKK